MNSTREQLQEWLSAPEGAHYEFKEAKGAYSFDKLLDYCVALANEGGGKVILGVTDRRPRCIVGTEAFSEPGRTEAGLHDRLLHRIPVEEISTENGRVVVVHVPSRLPGAVWQIGGRYLKRAGDNLAALTDAELRRIFSETGPDFSAETCEDASLFDMTPEAVACFRERWAAKTRDGRKLGWTDTETLMNAEMLVDGRITYAALILFGTPAALTRRLAQAEVVFEYRSSEASGPAADREEYRKGFLLFHDALWQRVNLRNNRQSYQDGLFRMELPTFDEVSVREALLNAVAHRDYRLGGSVFVRQHAHRLEVVSPGGFPPGVTPENVLDQQNPRNRRLAEALAKCGMIERSGQGMNMMYESAIRQGKALPSLAGTTDHEVRLTLEGAVKNPAFVRYMERLGEETLRSFSTYDFLALDYVHHEKPLPDYLKARIGGLMAAGAVESAGKGKGTRFFLSKHLHAAIGEKGTYTRKKGLDRETNKALLLRHIQENRDSGSRMEELRQVLPAKSRSQIQVFLRELIKSGLVRVEGLTRGARWYPGPEGYDCNHSSDSEQ